MILLPTENSKIIFINNTRPISLLPCLSKVFEKCLLIYLHQWMNNNGILSSEQTGFRTNHSTTMRFIQFPQDFSEGLFQKTAALVIYVDFTKAFDQLWHGGLLYKLFRMNCPRELFLFIMNYLKDQKCYIDINGISSKVFTVDKGVPQGSCLGPILFLLFHCSLPQALPSASHLHLYADDLALIITASPWWKGKQFQENMQKLGQQTLNELQIYADTWGQPINSNKTPWQWIHRRVTVPSLNLFISQLPIERTPYFEYLGIIVDNRLTFNKHWKYIRKNSNQFQSSKIYLKYQYLFTRDSETNFQSIHVTLFSTNVRGMAAIIYYRY